MKPGIYFDIDIDVYHYGPGISNSGLGTFAKSPAHYYALNLAPNRPPPKDRSGQLEGSLAHCAILEPAHFAQRYITIPADAPRRPTEAQWNAKNPSADSVAAMSWWREFNARTGGATIITADQHATALAQAASVFSLTDVAALLSVGRPEVSAYWIDPVTGELCRCRPDWVSPAGEGVILLDVKTYSDASPAEFARQVARKGYHRQDAFYSDGYALASGKPVLGFVFVAVESEYPFAACAVMLDDQGREKGRSDNRALLDAYAHCRQSGEWPGYSQTIELISLPAWAI
jgi:exodeoxyribonuclease VIII